MKKLILLACAAIVYTGSFAQYVNAESTTNGTSDAAQITANISLTDMIDIAPSANQIGTASLNTWTEWDNGADLVSPDGNNLFEYSVSATRGFHVTASATDPTCGACTPVRSFNNSHLDLDATLVAGAGDADWALGTQTVTDFNGMAMSPVEFLRTNHGGHNLHFTLGVYVDDLNASETDNLYSNDLPAGVYSSTIAILASLN